MTYGNGYSLKDIPTVALSPLFVRVSDEQLKRETIIRITCLKLSKQACYYDSACLIRAETKGLMTVKNESD